MYFRQHFFNCWQSNSPGVVKTTFGVSRGILWAFFIEERLIFNIFFHFEQNHCWLLPNIYGRVSETSIYVSGEFWEKNWKKKISFTSFVLWVKKFGTWANKFRQGLPKVHSACPGEFLEKNKNSEKRIVS